MIPTGFFEIVEARLKKSAASSTSMCDRMNSFQLVV
jgi:hypothetical protein